MCPCSASRCVNVFTLDSLEVGKVYPSLHEQTQNEREKEGKDAVFHKRVKRLSFRYDSVHPCTMGPSDERGEEIEKEIVNN